MGTEVKFTSIKITQDAKVYINDFEVPYVEDVDIYFPPISHPKVTLTITVDEVDVNHYDWTKIRERSD